MNKITDHLQAEWYKYVLEILVLIIGIYGAFALENWNEERKAKAEEVILFQNILEDLKMDSLEMLKRLDQLKFQLEVADRMIRDIQDEDSAYQHENAGYIRFWTIYLPRTQGNHGDIVSNIRNQSVRRALQAYFYQDDGLRSVFVEFEQVVMGMVRPYLGKKDVYQLDYFDSMENLKIVIPQSKVNELLADPEFKQILFERRFKTYQIIRELKLLLQSNKSLSDLLMKEISK